MMKTEFHTMVLRQAHGTGSAGRRQLPVSRRSTRRLAAIALLLLGTALLILGAVFLGMFAVLGFATLFGGNLLMGYLCGGLLVLVAAAVLVLAMGRVGKEAGDDAGAKANSPSRSDGA